MSFINIESRVPDVVMVQTNDTKLTLKKVHDNVWKNGDVTVYSEGNTWFLTSPAEAIKRVLIRWNHRFDPNVQILNDHYERGYGDLEWKGYEAERLLPWYFMMRENAVTNGYGVKTNPDAICFWQVSDTDISLYMDVRSLGQGVRLGEKKLLLATVVTFEGSETVDAFDSTRELCKRMCTNGVFPDAPVYGGNNWYYAYGFSSSEEILKDTDRIAAWSEGLENRPFMVIDACWQSSLVENYTCAGGPYEGGNSQFPDMAALAAEMKKKNVRPGIWMRPLLTTEGVPEHWVLRTIDEFGDVMDPTVPEALEKIGADVSRIVSWGYELIKHDFSTFDILDTWGPQLGTKMTDMDKSFYDGSVTTAQAIKMLYKTIYDNAKGALIIGCNTIGHLITGWAQIQRTGDDTSGLDWERTRKMGVNTLSHRMPQHKIFFDADADCVGLTVNVPWEMNAKWLDVLARSSTVCFISAAPEALSPEVEEKIKEAFRIASENRDMLKPQDWLTNMCPTTWKNTEETYCYDWNYHDRFVFNEDDVKL